MPFLLVQVFPSETQNTLPSFGRERGALRRQQQSYCCQLVQVFPSETQNALPSLLGSPLGADELKLRTGEGQPEGADELFSLREKWRSNNWQQ